MSAAVTQFNFNYVPRIKGKSFYPNPVAREGIPAYADSLDYPKTAGTSAHEDWWNEQIDRCLNGYTTGGVYIPGRYYFYLNFCKISTVGRGYHYPDFVDLDLDFFLLVEYVKNKKRGIISLKARRKGLSEKASKGILSHGLLFTAQKYRGGICSGLDDYTKDFTTKIKETNQNMPPEFYLHMLTDNDKMYEAGWKDSTTLDDTGSRNNIKMATMFNNPNVFKGKALDDCIFEEAGEFKMLLRGYSATKACFQVANRMVGTPYVYGTGGKITSATKEFQEMWGDAEHYYLEKFLVPGVRIYTGSFIGSHDEEGNIPDKCPNILKLAQENNYSYEQVLGCEDVDFALNEILSTRKFLTGSKNRELYYEHFQDFGLTEKEMFLKFSGNNFDVEAIADQRLKLASLPTLPYNRYTLEWKKNEAGEILIPFQVEAKPVNEKELTREIEERLVYIRFHPQKHYRNLFVAGGDSYDQDTSKTSKSLGAFVVMSRRNNPFKSDDGKSLAHMRIPCLLIRNRPKRKETFYENCLKASIYYDLIGNTLFDASKPLVIKYYKDNGCKKYLAPRPRSFEAEDSTQSHDFGWMPTNNSRSKPQMISLIQTWVLDELQECVFDLIVEGLSEYDITQKDSDWDEIDALGIALIRDADMKTKPRSSIEDEKQDQFAFPEWKIEGGILVDVSDRKKEKADKPQPDMFLRMLENGTLNGLNDE